MTGVEIRTLAQKRVRDSSSNVDWDALFAIVIDEIFTHRPWKFSKLNIAYVHPQDVFEKRFDTDAVELALNKIISVTSSQSYALTPTPVPLGDSGRDLVYYPYKDFVAEFPDHLDTGNSRYYTIIEENDGDRGMQIGLYEIPSADTAVWVYGEFIPAYTIDGNPLPILPKQFHRLVVDGLVHYAAEELAKERLAVSARIRFELGKKQLEDWDSRNPGYTPVRKPYVATGRKGPFFPGNFPRGYSR